MFMTCLVAKKNRIKTGNIHFTSSFKSWQYTEFFFKIYLIFEDKAWNIKIISRNHVKSKVAFQSIIFSKTLLQHGVQASKLVSPQDLD